MVDQGIGNRTGADAVICKKGLAAEEGLKVPALFEGQHLHGEIKMKQKPRNPLVALARFRQAGHHGKTEKAKRQAENNALKQAMKRLGFKDEVSLSVVFA